MRSGIALAACVTALLACAAPAGAQTPPTVTVNPATAVGPDSYNVSGSVNPNGTDTQYEWVWSDFGTTAYSFATANKDIGSGNAPVATALTIRAVSDWSYHFNIHAFNSAGESTDGTDQTVPTPPYASKPGAPGDLDVARASTHSPGFAVQGRAGPTNDGSDPPGGGFPNNYPDNTANALVVQHNGAVLVAGTADPDGNTQLVNGFAVLRFTGAGGVDTTFNGGKPAIATFSGESGVTGDAIGLQELAGATSDDGIVVAGTGTSSGQNDLLLARYTPSGAPDGNFGPNGTGQLTEPGGGTAAGLVVAPDNTLWVAGGLGTSAVLWHFNASGTTVLNKISVPGTGPATAIALQADGDLVVAAGTSSLLTLIRFTPSAALDTSFGSGGIATAAGPGPALAVAVDEHQCTGATCPQRALLAAGGDSSHFTIARFTETGKLDTTFGSGGVVTTAGTASPARALVVQGNGDPIAGGVDNSNVNTGPEMLVARYTTTGALDKSFGIGGKVRTGYPDPGSSTMTPSGVGADAEVNALALLPDGRLVAAGVDANQPQIIVAPRTRGSAGQTGRGSQLIPSYVPDMALVRYQAGPPATHITFAPPATTGAQNATFAFTSTVTGASFQCQIDTGAFTKCTSGQAFGPLSFAQHTFTVRSIDEFGHIDLNPPTYTWLICSGCDNLPKTQITGQPPALTNTKTATFTFIADDPTDTFQCQLDGGAFSACSSPDVLGNLADGSHTFVVRAVNGKGADPAPPSFTWTVDTVAPHTTITSGPSGTLSSPTATFTFTSDKPGSTFACKLDGAPFSSCISPITYIVGNGTHTFSVRATDPAGNVDPNPPGRTFTFVQTQCNSTITFGDVAATGCFGKQAGRYTSTAGSDVQLNGLTLHPTAATTTITLDPVEKKITSTGQIQVSAGEVPVDTEQLNWPLGKPDKKGAVGLPAVSPPQGSDVEGLPFEGDLSLSLNKQQGADLAGNVQLPLGQVTSFLQINGTVGLHTKLGVGLQHELLTVERDDLEFDGLDIKQLKVVYSPTDDTWEGAASIVIPTPHELAVMADLQFQHGSFHKFSGSANNIDFQIVDGVFLQRISVVFGVDPTTFGGGLGLSFGPTIDGADAVGVDGNFLYTAAFGNTPGQIHVDGSVTLAGFKLANGYFDYFTSGKVDFGGSASLGLPDVSSSNPQGQPVYISAALAGIVQAPHFNVDVKANVDLNFIDQSVSAELLVSDIGIVACAHLSAFGFGWSPGAGYTWATGSFDPMWDSCSVSNYQTLPLGSTAAAGPQSVLLPAGSALLGLIGSTAQPRVTLIGPHGQRVTVPTNSVAPLMVHGFMVFQDPTDKTTFIAVQHSGGGWKIELEPGSSTITQIRTARILPPPRIAARVSGHGRRRTLSWRLATLPGQRVVFWEEGRDTAHIIGSTTRPQGTLRFTIGDGSAGRRTIVAQVLSDGRPRANLSVAHFTAPGPLKPSRPTHLAATAVRGGGVHVSWRPSAVAQRYVVEVDTSDGAHLVEFTSGHSRALTVHNVVPIAAATIKVSGQLNTGVTGPTARIKFKAATHHKRRKRHHKKRKG